LLDSLLQEMGGWEWQPFESNYRPVFHPPSYSNSIDPQQVTQQPPSLCDLCIRKVVSDTSLAESARTVPVTILRDLVSAAVQQGRYGSLAILVESWPYEVFKLEQLSLPYLTSNPDNLDTEDRKSLIKKSTKLVITLVNKIVTLGKTCIRVLDISGYPLDSDFLVSTLKSFQTSSSSPRLTLVLDLYLTDEICFSLNRVGIPVTEGLRVIVRNVYFSITQNNSYWEEEYIKTLDKLQHDWAEVFDINNVSGLELSMLDIRSFFAQRSGRGDFFYILSDIFKHLKVLDLSYNAINLNGCEIATRILRDFLSRASCLERLDLSGNRLTNNVPALFSTTLNLRYLNLSGTQLRQVDLSYLARFNTLEQLDISSNNLGNKLNILKNIFTALEQLEILEMVDCKLSQAHIDDLIPYLDKTRKLKMVNLRENEGIKSVKLKCHVLVDPPYEEEDILEDYDNFY